MAQPEFNSKYLTAFDFQVICLSAQKIIDKVHQGESIAVSPSGGALNQQSLPDFAVIICDDREYLKDIAKILLYGNFIANGRKWRFYTAADLDLPTMVEV